MKRLAVCLLLAIIFAVPAPATATSPVARSTTAQILKRLGGQPCPDSEFTCVTLKVPLDHFDSRNRRTIDVVFAVLPATGQRKGMFVVATGGPGVAGLTSKDSYVGYYDPASSGASISSSSTSAASANLAG